jgi:hypothetical protein
MYRDPIRPQNLNIPQRRNHLITRPIAPTSMRRNRNPPHNKILIRRSQYGREQ